MKEDWTRVGVRELRQNLSLYLRRVLNGETLEVTDRGRGIALLAPLPEPSTPVQRLVAVGRATAPQGRLTEVLPPQGKTSTRLGDALAEQRAERLQTAADRAGLVVTEP